MSDLLAAVVAPQEIQGDAGSAAAMTSCLGAQILRDAFSADHFRDLCRRTSRFCEEGQPCPLIADDEAQILRLSSRRGPACPSRRTAPAAEASAGPQTVMAAGGEAQP